MCEPSVREANRHRARLVARPPVSSTDGGAAQASASARPAQRGRAAQKQGAYPAYCLKPAGGIAFSH
jgi:hypothetical protein